MVQLETNMKKLILITAILLGSVVAMAQPEPRRGHGHGHGHGAPIDNIVLMAGAIFAITGYLIYKEHKDGN